MVRFILNDKLISTEHPPGMTLLDFIRYEENLKGTKIGCREGDCGACTVISGQLVNNTLKYKTIVSCLTPLGNVHGKHIVTIEGLNQEQLSPIQQALVNHNGTQCGFCTPGFAVSLTAFLLSDCKSDIESATAAIDGNICRCTGYKSIERAAIELVMIKEKIKSVNPVEWLVDNRYLPEYFNNIGKWVKDIHILHNKPKGIKTIVGGGTDLYVQKPDELIKGNFVFIENEKQEEAITFQDDICIIKAYATATDIMESVALQDYFPRLNEHFKLISSTPIRNMGTLAGNIVNASPIGDLSIFFLALDAELVLSNEERKIKLKDFFLDYKKIELRKNELIKAVEFKLPGKTDHFNFEKVSKRQYLDIASVNSAAKFKIDNDIIHEAHLSAGGVSPIPQYLQYASEFLIGKEINAETLLKTNEIAQDEITPISDIRGSGDYKRLLLRQLIFAHFFELFPNIITVNELMKIQ